MKLGLGTAQFGMQYGISNSVGQLSFADVADILTLAHKQGVCFLDTAPLYQASEEVIGQFHQQKKVSFNVVTKTPKIKRDTINKRDADELQRVFQLSLQRLNQQKVYGLLFHHADDLLSSGGEHLYERACFLKQTGLVNKIGVSVYTKDEIERLLARYEIDLIQLPINVFDQQLLQNQYLTYLKKLNIEIHARSVFLQGLLLMQPQMLPAYFQPILPHVEAYQRYLGEKGLSLVSAALGFVNQIKEIDVVLCGVHSKEHLTQLLAVDEEFDTKQFESFHLNSPQYTNPVNWKYST